MSTETFRRGVPARTSMEALKEDYPLAYACFLAVAAPFAISALVVVSFPAAMYTAWCDMRIFNLAIAPYLHLSPMPLWIAYAARTLMHMQQSPPVRKDEPKLLFFRTMLASVLGHTLALGLVYLVFRWWGHA